MDQKITLHKRPTNLTDGNRRLMNRIITYLNKLYPEYQPETTVKLNGKVLSFDEFAVLVDDRRKDFFKKYQTGSYANTDRRVFPEGVDKQVELIKDIESSS